jgi:hypothetical protein
VPESAHSFALATLSGTPETPTVAFESLRNELNLACKSCHLAPGADVGGFSYIDSYEDQTVTVNDERVLVGGIASQAEKMRSVLLDGSMPPAAIRKLKPEAYEALGKKMQAWIDAGKPQSATGEEVGRAYPQLWGLHKSQVFTDLGNCLPDEKTLGTDTNTDYFFERTLELPELLSNTDLSSLDSEVLAKNGTVAYNVEYPLWNDHIQKLRHVHIPAVIAGGKAFRPGPLQLMKQARGEDPQFDFPDNTRFYKTFFRGVKEKDGQVRFKPVETRLIVTRKAPRKPLYGTYVWNDEASEAKLLTTPYRDGTPWKDLTLSLDFDQERGAKRPYIVPAKHRCEQCHMGADHGSFVLGFTPLQINRRDLGEAGRDLPVGADELRQVSRLIAYGLLTPKDAAGLPKLEYYPSTRMLDDHTLRAQGYMLGNCAQCHNPRGYAKLQAEVPLDFSAGRIFNFDTNLTSKSFSNRKIVHHQGDLSQSYLFHRVASTQAELKTEVRMPLHSLGSPDCRAVKVFARWIKTYDPTLSPFDIDLFSPQKPCNEDSDYAAAEIDALEQDPTEASGPYRPRREDWNDPTTGMAPWYRDLRFNDSLHLIAKSRYAVDYWQDKAECQFPETTLQPDQIKSWMMRADRVTPVKPFGQLYWTTPGAYFYNITCTKCHGRLGEADGPLAQNLATWSGGSIRVANFRRGMFGAEGNNILNFASRDGEGRSLDLSGNYFIWMALEGTKMNPPPEVAELLGSNKAQMLKTIMDRCARQIPSNSKAAKPFFRDYDLFNEVCTHDNWPLTDERIQYDLETGLAKNPGELDVWLRKAASNAGWMIYDYVRSQISKGVQQYSQGECEAVFSKP